MAAPTTASTASGAGGAADPYLSDDFHPLRSASAHILAALRADESAPDADLYRRLVSSGGAGAHRYHPVTGEEGLGEPGAGGGGRSESSGNGGGRQPSTTIGGSGNVIGSPLGVLRGSRASTSNTGTTNGSPNNNSSSKPASPPTPYLRHERSLPLPAPLAAEAAKAQLSSSMGLLPAAQLAWLSADHKLFLWSYAGAAGDGNGNAVGSEGWGSGHSAPQAARQDYCAFAVPSGQCVVSVGLVRPKRGVFTPNVEWCLVVATPEEAVLCALARGPLDPQSEGTRGENGDASNTVAGGFRHGANALLRLIPTRFVLPTDSVPLLSVAGTSDGRIFLGGTDGGLYEMSYEGNRPSGGMHGGGGYGGAAAGSEAMERAIDDYFDGRGVFSLDDPSAAKAHAGLDVGGVLAGGKRVLSALTFGALDDQSPTNTMGQRPRKCRKIDHSSRAPGLAARVLPPAILRAGSGVFGSALGNEARKGGPIVSIVIDEERRCLYTLGSKGVVCAYDLSPLPHSNTTGNADNASSSVAAPPPRLASVLDAPATAKLYLDAVSRGRMYPPTTSQKLALGTIAFPGGSAGAQSGVGGMDGARDLLKRHDAEGRAAKASAAGKGRNGARDALSNAAGILHPLSLHLVPPAESKSLTLVAVTGGGLRYYLSSLSSTAVHAAQAQGGFAYGASQSARGGDPRAALRPGRKMTFCHVRAPPPYTASSGEGNDGVRFEAVRAFARDAAGGLAPGIHAMSGRSSSAVGGDVVKGWYGDGAFVLALDVGRGAKPPGATTGRADFFAAPEGQRAARPAAGDAIVAALPDVAARSSAAPTPTSGSATSSLPTAPGGISEAVLLPLAGQGGTPSPVLPGGRTFDIVATGTDYGKTSSLAGLFVHSETPSDAELQVGPLPAFAPRPTPAPRPGAAGAASSAALVVSKAHGRGIVSSALAALAHYLRSGPYGREVGTVGGARGFGPPATFRLSRRYGCGAGGFGPSAGEGAAASKARAGGGTSARNKQIVGAASTKAARLPGWLLRPSPAPLSVAAAQHLAPSGSTSDKVAILNAGGLHFFARASLPDALATALARARNVATDATVRNFFVSYGYAEGCALCFALATSGASDDALRAKAAEAALCHARRPVMTLAKASIGEGLDPLSAYTFQPSSLYDGLVQCLSRLLRPVWHKPAVVATEGRPLSVRSATARYYAALPAKVELLLDEKTLGEIRRPLELLQELMKARFVPAVRAVPGAKAATTAGDDMDVDEDNGGRITQALRNQSRAAAQRTSSANQSQPAAAPSDLQSAAYQTEDRNVHALYRLVARSVQLLDLLSCLRRAHDAPSLPDVAWGRLHGLTCAQLAIEREGQRRIDAVVNGLVCRGGTAAAEGDRLADELSRKCYLYFSAGARLTYLGFRAANDALARPSSSPQRGALANQAARYLRSAARRWHSPALVAGRSMSRDGSSVGWEEAFANATEAGSPLALAADILMKLGNMGGLADVCLICAANFGGGKVPRDARKEAGSDDAGQDSLPWERGLYHRPPPSDAAADDSGSTASGSRAVVTGLDPAPADALRTCHGILFHYVSQLLGDAGPENQRLADELVATCAASSDAKFLHSLYEHLLATNREETLLRIDSPSLEAWLVDDKKDAGLVWKYHSFHGRHRLAGDAMYQRATEAGRVPLDRRIECLTRAANSYSSALELNPVPNLTARSLLGQGTSPAMQDKPMTQNELEARVRTIEEQLDVAAIQKRVLDTVAQSEGTNLDAAQTDALTYALLPVSDIYNDYACPLNLFDACLLILHTCKHNEGDTIATLWKSVLCEEVLPCATRSRRASEFLNRLKQGSLLEEETVVLGTATGDAPTFEHGEWIPLLRTRVAALGRELYGKGADYTFPLDLLARELEGLRAVGDGARGEDGASSPPWPAQTLLDAGVPFYELIEIYDSLLTEDDAAGGGVDATTRLQRLASLSELLELWVTAALTSPLVSANSLGDREGSSASSQLARATNSGALLPRIEQYKQALQELGGGNPASSAIDERLTTVEEAIRKQYC